MALLKVTPGDIVAIPCEKNGEWGFVCSRVILVGATKWIEVFDEFSVDFEVASEDARSGKYSKKFAYLTLFWRLLILGKTFAQ